MSLVQQIKRAAINHGMYKGNVDDNWEPADRLMYHRLCTRFHGHYTDYPSRSNQSKDFLEWLDNYKDPEYSEERSTVSVVNPGGIDLRQLIADKQPVNTEGASKQEVRARDAMVNENHFTLPKPPKKLTPDPKDVVNQEANNELPNKDTVQSNSEAGNQTGNNESGNDDSTKSNDGQDSAKELANSEQSSNASSGEQEKAEDPAGNTSPPREAAKPARIVSSNKPAPIVSSNTIKTR